MSSSEMHDALRLHALGGLSISSNGSTLSGTVARRRSLALLALVSSAGEAGVSDERALALLWPDFDLPRARNNLKQVAFTLRQALRRDAFLRTSTTLRLDPAHFSVDRWDFERAIANRDAEGAVALYGGGFLAGFHISGLPEFERWVESEREKLCHLYAGAVSALALGAEASGDYASAIEWWRKAVAADRLNDTNAQRLVRALALSGDTVGAIQQAKVHVELIKQELETTPSPSFQRLMEDLRKGVAVVASSSNVRIPTPPSVRAIVLAPTARDRSAKTPAVGIPAVPANSNGFQPDGRDASATPAHGVPVAASSANGLTISGPASRQSREPRLRPISEPSRRDRRVWTTGERRVAGFTTRLTSAAVILVVIGTLAAFAVSKFGPSAAAETDAEASDAVVMPFSVIGDQSGDFGSVVSELLAASLDGSMGLRALAVGGNDSLQSQNAATRRATAQRLASNLKASFFVSGDIFQSGDRVRIAAEFRSRRDESLLDRAQAEGARSEIFDLVDRVASQLLAGRIAGGRRDVVRVASVTTSSLPAAKAYYRAEAALAEGGFRAAIDAYEEAVQLDPTFALAHYGLAVAADMLGDDDIVLQSAAKAMKHSAHLPNRQRRLLAAFVARQQGDVSGARRAYAQLTSDYPADAEAWLGLGETIFHLNPLEGQPATDARNAFERAIKLDSLNTGAWLHLARIAALENDDVRSRRMIARARALAPDRAVARYALHVMALGVPLDDATNDARGRRAASGVPITDAVELLVSSGPEELRRFARRLSVGEVRGYGLRLQSLVEAGQGRIMVALALLDSCSTTNHSLAIEARSRLAALAFVPVEAGDINLIRHDLNSWNGEAHPTEMAIDSASHDAAHPYLKLHRLGLIALRVNDHAAAESITRQLDAATNSLPPNAPGRMLATSLRAHLAAARGRTREALKLLEEISGARIASATSLESYDRLLRAQLLEQTGRYDDALGFYAQLGSRSPFEVMLVWQAELGTARIHEKRGNTAMAARYYRKVAERLKYSDAAFRQEREAAERKAVELLPLDSSRRF
jgi:DNA-binding SARP family transcriptional activator/tetratricopeptide (TPR) repeat protein